jgi:hypothetical protein
MNFCSMVHGFADEPIVLGKSSKKPHVWQSEAKPGLTLHKSLAEDHRPPHDSCNNILACNGKTKAASSPMDQDLTDEEHAAFQRELARLREEHNDLDAAIAALESSTAINQLQVQRLKKRKLALKDRMYMLEDQMTPDIIA